MNTALNFDPSDGDYVSAVSEAEPRWYAVYTLPRHEKVVAGQLGYKSIDCYLPLYEKVSHWKDRNTKLQLPLFPGYVFVHLPFRERAHVLEVPSVVRIVGFNRRPAPLSDDEIEAIRRCVATRKAEPFPYLTKGKRVRVKAGPLQGMEGIIIRRKNKLRIVVSIESIMRSVALELEASDVRLAA